MNDWLTLLGTTAEAGSAGSTVPIRPAIMPISANIEIRRIRLILRVENSRPLAHSGASTTRVTPARHLETAGDLGEPRRQASSGGCRRLRSIHAFSVGWSMIGV